MLLANDAAEFKALVTNDNFRIDRSDDSKWSATSFDVIWNSLFIASYVWSIRWSISILVNPDVGIGGNVEMITFPLFKCLFLSSKNVRNELKTTGKIGICALIATWNAPFLNGCNSPVLRRVPSGKIHNLIFLFLISFEALLRCSRDASEFMRLINIKPQSQAAKPNGQAKKSSFLATTVHLFITGHNSNIPIVKQSTN